MNRKKELLTEMKELEKEFKNKQKEYINYNCEINNLSTFVNNYENLLNNEKQLKKMKKTVLLNYFLCALMECILIYLIPPIIFEFIIINAIFSLGIVFQLLFYNILSDIELSPSLNKIKKEIKDNKSNYLNQKALITSYSIERDSIREYLIEILDKIRKKELELFQSNENQHELIIEETNQNNYNNNEIKEKITNIKHKKIVKIK